MYREFYMHSPLLTLPIIALVIFLVVFGAIVVTTLRKRGGELEPLAQLPLNDDQEVRHER
jgi:hypothetical protein